MHHIWWNYRYMQKPSDQYLAAAGPPNPPPSWQLQEGTQTRSPQKYHRSVRCEWVSCQHWVTQKNIDFRTFTFAWTSVLKLTSIPALGHSINRQVQRHNISRHIGGDIFFFKLFCKKDAISWSMEAKDGAKEREPLPSTPPLIGMSILSRPTCQSLLDRCLVGQSRPEAGQPNSRIKTAPLGSQNKTAHRLLV